MAKIKESNFIFLFFPKEAVASAGLTANPRARRELPVQVLLCADAGNRLQKPKKNRTRGFSELRAALNKGVLTGVRCTPAVRGGRFFFGVLYSHADRAEFFCLSIQ